MNHKNFRPDNKLGKFLKEELTIKQKNKCVICESILKNTFFSHLDHDHETGEIRGILCRDCNSMLRKPNDNIKSLNLTKEYLINSEKHQTKEYNVNKHKKNGYIKDLLKIQNNCCGICKKEFNNIKICLDHNHKNGMIRGLLCTNCNFMLRFPNDTIKILDKAIEYINDNPLKYILIELENIMKIKKELLKLEAKENNKKSLSDPNTREKMRIKKIEYFSNPENRIKHGRIQSIRFKRPEEKEKSKQRGKDSWINRRNKNII